MQLVLEGVWLIGLDKLSVLGEKLNDLQDISSETTYTGTVRGTNAVHLALFWGDDGDDINGRHFGNIFD